MAAGPVCLLVLADRAARLLAARRCHHDSGSVSKAEVGLLQDVYLSPVNIMDRGISDFLCGLHRLWIIRKASLEALEELLHHLFRHAISYGLMRAEAVVVRLD